MLQVVIRYLQLIFRKSHSYPARITRKEFIKQYTCFRRSNKGSPSCSELSGPFTAQLITFSTHTKKHIIVSETPVTVAGLKSREFISECAEAQTERGSSFVLISSISISVD